MNNEQAMWLIKKIVSQHFGMRVSEITYRTRRAEVVRPRQIAHALIYSLTRSPLKSIATTFDMKNHTSVMHSIQVVGDRRELEREYNQVYKTLEARCVHVFYTIQYFEAMKKAYKKPKS